MVVIENNAPTPTTYDVVFVVESSANVGAYFETLKSSYILPAIEHFNGGPPEAVDYGCNYSCSLYTLVTYCADDHAPGLAASCSSPTTSAQEFIQRLDNIEFSGGYGDLSYQIAEGLSTALQVFDDVNQLREPNVNAQKHCVLISNSTPVQVPCQENIKFAGLLPDQLLTNLAEIGVNFSIISPRKIPLLFKLFEKASGDLNSMKNFAVDSRHLVLLQGFHLQERPTSPEQSKTEVSMDLKSIIPIVSTTSQLTTPAGVSLMSSLVKGGSPGTMPAPSPQQQDTTLDGGFKPPGSLPLSAAAPMPPSPASLPTASTPGGSIVTASSSGPPVPSASQLQNSMQRQPSGKTGHSSAHEIASQILNAVRSGAQSSMGGGHQPQGNPGQQQPPQPSQAPTSASPGFPFPMSTVSQTGMGQTQSMPQNSVPNSASPAIMSTGLNPQQQPGGHEVPLPDLSSVQPQQARRVIWSGSLEWQDKAKSAQGLDTKFTRSLPCHMSLNQTDPDLNAGKWPTKLIMQLLPSALLAPLQTLFRKSRNVSFDFSSGDVEPLKNLHSLMNKGFAGCVYFPNVQGCEIKVLMLLYSNRKRQFMGLIPNDQTGFLNAIRTLIAKTKGRVGNQLNTGEQQAQQQQQQQQQSRLLGTGQAANPAAMAAAAAASGPQAQPQQNAPPPANDFGLNDFEFSGAPCAGGFMPLHPPHAVRHMPSFLHHHQHHAMRYSPLDENVVPMDTTAPMVSSTSMGMPSNPPNPANQMMNTLSSGPSIPTTSNVVSIGQSAAPPTTSQLSNAAIPGGMMNSQLSGGLSMSGGQMQLGSQAPPMTQASKAAPQSAQAQMASAPGVNPNDPQEIERKANLAKIQELQRNLEMARRREVQFQQQQQHQKVLEQQQQQQQHQMITQRRLQQQRMQMQPQAGQQQQQQPQQPMGQQPTSQQLKNLLLNQQQQALRQQQQQQMMMQQRAPQPQTMAGGPPQQNMQPNMGGPQMQGGNQGFLQDDFSLPDVIM